MEKICEMCGLTNGRKCLVLGIEIDPKSPACAYYDSNPSRCEICGQVILKEQTIIHIDNLGGPIHITCEKCAARVSSCAGCKNAQACRFDTDPSPLPKIIQQRVQQGSVIMMNQVKNPDRIAITCEEGCPCWDFNERACNRDFGVCGGYNCIWE